MAKLTKILFISHNNLLNVKIQSIHVATKTELIGLLQQLIPFCGDLVYIMVPFPTSLISFISLSTEKSSSLHTIVF